jgi:predicted Rdx family selenoprotein
MQGKFLSDKVPPDFCCRWEAVAKRVVCEKEISGDMEWMERRTWVSQETSSNTALELRKIASLPVTKFTLQ